MLSKKYNILYTLLILAGLFPANIFLYAQKSFNFKELKRLVSENKTDSLNLKLIRIYNDSTHLSQIEKGKLYFIIGKNKTKDEKDGLAYNYLKKAELIFSELSELDLLARTQYEIFYLLKSRNYPKEKTKKYLDKFYDFALKKNNNKDLLEAYFGYGLFYLDSINYKKAKNYYEKTIFLSTKLKDTLSLAKSYNNKASILKYFYKNTDSARYFYEKAWFLYNLKNRTNEKFSLSFNLGNSYKVEGKFKKALEWYIKADSIKLTQFKNNYKILLHAQIANTYANLNNYKKAHEYLESYIDYNDALNKEQQDVAIADLDTKYETEKKEKENIQLKAENKKKQLYLIGLLGTVVAFVIFGYLSYRNLKRRKEIAEKNIAIEKQKIVTLVKDQELLSIDAMIEGQEKERKKIAEDLHDNLGSTLATLKLHFDNYREHLSTNNSVQLGLLDSTENILNVAYSKVRTMAHANQASVLAGHSLIEAIKSLAHNISLANKTQIEVMSFGFDKPLNHTTEITLFRITQELITNIIKHANAKTALIDLNLFDGTLGLIVEDDGVGFNIAILNKKTTGMGLNSIKERIERVNGAFEIDTKIGKGTTILIDIPIKQNEF